MSSERIIKTESKSLSEILVGKNRYMVPRFQRDYSWTNEQLDTLKADIEELIITKDAHFFGHIVLFPSQDNLYEIIDGQQRLTTVLLIALAAVRTLNASEEKSRPAVKSVDYCNNLIWATSLTSSNPPRIQLNHRNDDYYRLLLKEEKPQPPKVYKVTNKKLQGALEYYLDWFKDKDVVDLADLLEIIFEKLFISVVTVQSMASAFSVFESLNHKGSRLLVADLVKNLLMKKISKQDGSRSLPEEKLAQIDNRWDRIIETVGEQEVGHYLRSLAMLDSDGKIVTMKKLYVHIDKETVDKNAAKKYMDKLLHYSVPYKSIRGMTKLMWKHYDKNFSDVLPAMSVLRLFNIRMPISLLMAAADWFHAEQYRELAKVIIVISVRFSVVGDNPSRDLEKQYADLVKKVKEENFGTADIVTNLKEGGFYPKDETFHMDFRSLKLKSSHLRRAAYFLAAIRNGSIDLDFSKYKAEKIVCNYTLENQGKAMEMEDLHDVENTLANYQISESGRRNGSRDRSTLETRSKELADKAIALWVLPQS